MGESRRSGSSAAVPEIVSLIPESPTVDPCWSEADSLIGCGYSQCGVVDRTASSHGKAAREEYFQADVDYANSISGMAPRISDRWSALQQVLAQVGSSRVSRIRTDCRETRERRTADQAK